MGSLAYSNTETLAVVKWLVRSRLMSVLCEPEAPAAFLRGIADDLAELSEAGLIEFAEAECTDRLEATVSVHLDGCLFVLEASAADGRIEMDRRAECSFLR